MTLTLTDSNDTIIIGIDAVDELVVEYFRNAELIHSRTGLKEIGGSLTRGSAIGSIAAVIYQVRLNDADATFSHRKKAA
jgi:hypothetical protein